MKKRLLLFLLVIGFHSIAARAAISVESVGMTVSDMDRAVEFYSALTFQKISDVEVLGEEFEHLEGVFGARMRIVRMQLGKEYLDLTQYLAPPGRPIPADSRSNDLWFQHIAIVVRDMDQAFDKLRALKVQFVSTGPQTLPPSIKAAAGIKAFYFRDPDQHNLEIIYFPPGKGDPRWQEKTDNLFLGIDHTAIGISKHRRQFAFLSRPARTAQSGRERKFRDRTRTFESGVRSAPAESLECGRTLGQALSFSNILRRAMGDRGRRMFTRTISSIGRP